MSVTSTLSQPARRSPVKRIVLLTSLLVACLSAAAIGVMAHVPDDQIAPGVRVGNLDLGGKSLPEARTALEHWAETQQATPLNLHFTADSGITKSWNPPAGEVSPAGRMDSGNAGAEIGRIGAGMVYPSPE